MLEEQRTAQSAFKKQLVKFDLRKMGNLSLLLFILPFLVCLCINLLALKRPLLVTNKVYWDIVLVIGLYAVGMFCHEGLHALAALAFGGCTPKDIKFGAHPKQLMLYCHIKKPLTVGSYRIMLLAPLFITGVIPLLLSLFLGNIFLLLVFCLLVSGCAGDLIMVASLRKLDKNQLISDHPTAPAYYLIYKEDALPADFCEVTEEDEATLIEEMSVPGGVQRSPGKNNLLKILAIVLFLAFAVLIVFLIGLFMQMF